MRAAVAHRSGFTLLELMVSITILAGVLLLVPPNLYSFGARSRLDNASNTLVSTLGGAREQAIIDGHTVKLELGMVKGTDGTRHHAHRLVFTNIPSETSELLQGDTETDDDERPKEREWLTSTWHRLGLGVEFSGISERADNWVKLKTDQSYFLSFEPDGSVEKAVAFRIESTDLENVRKEGRTMTVIVNPLTAEAQAYDGFFDIPEAREENDFQK